MSDEEIQNLFESGDRGANDLDSRAYRAVFRSVSKEPLAKISDSFAERVVRKITIQQKREARRDFIWLSFGVFFLLVGLVLTAGFAGLQFQLGFLKEMSGYAGVFIFGAAVILVFNWFEKKALPKTSH